MRQDDAREQEKKDMAEEKIKTAERREKILEAPIPKKALVYNTVTETWAVMTAGGVTSCQRNAETVCHSNCSHFFIVRDKTQTSIQVTLFCGAVPLSMPFNEYVTIALEEPPKEEE